MIESKNAKNTLSQNCFAYRISYFFDMKGWWYCNSQSCVDIHFSNNNSFGKTFHDKPKWLWSNLGLFLSFKISWHLPFLLQKSSFRSLLLFPEQMCTDKETDYEVTELNWSICIALFGAKCTVKSIHEEHLTINQTQFEWTKGLEAKLSGDFGRADQNFARFFWYGSCETLVYNWRKKHFYDKESVSLLYLLENFASHGFKFWISEPVNKFLILKRWIIEDNQERGFSTAL